MQKYLLLINIGPVQGFIATARRTRDLYAGSRLLSDAAYAVAKTLGEKGLIFPSPEKHTLKDLSQAGIPNVIMGIVETENPARLVKNAKDQAVSALLEAWKHVEAKAGIHTLNPDATKEQKASGLIFNPDAAKEQIKDLLEFYWVALPLERDEDYARVREEATRLMAARKNTRNFNQVSWGASVPKSSLDGALGSVIYGAPENLRQRYGVLDGEELSGVDVLKRLYTVFHPQGKKLNFASTSHVAALPYFIYAENVGKLQRLIEVLEEIGREINTRFYQPNKPPRIRLRDLKFKPLRELIEKALGNSDENAPMDPSLIFAGRLNEYKEGKGKDKLLEDAQKKLVRIFAEIEQAAQQKHLPSVAEPYPYYAIILGDGDHMGKIISKQKTPHEHRALSTAVTEFSEEVKRIVAKHNGSLVYSGGDDVLALLPLHTALACARELDNAFKKELEPFSSEEVTPSLSIGMAVVHHLFDLGEAFNLARRAEKAAKERRNSLAVIWSPRSGVETLVKGRWEEPCAKPCALDKRLATFAHWRNEERIPSGFAYELKEMVEELQREGVGTDRKINQEQIKEIVALEAQRILKRKGVDDPSVLTAMKTYLEKLGAKALANELIAARPFAEAFELADPNVNVEICLPNNGKGGDQ